MSVTPTVFVVGFVTDGDTGGFEWRPERASAESVRQQWVREGDADITEVKAIEIPFELLGDRAAITDWLDNNSELWEPTYGEGRSTPCPDCDGSLMVGEIDDRKPCPRCQS